MPLISARTVCLLVFVYSFLAGLIIQKVIFPEILDGYHGGNGLLVNGDSLYFHDLATELAATIKYNGWEVWSLGGVQIIV